MSCTIHTDRIELLHSTYSLYPIFINRYDQHGLYFSIRLNFENKDISPTSYYHSQLWWKKEFGYQCNTMSNLDSFSFIRDIFDQRYERVGNVAEDDKFGFEYIKRNKCDCYKYFPEGI